MNPLLGKSGIDGRNTLHALTYCVTHPTTKGTGGAPQVSRRNGDRVTMGGNHGGLGGQLRQPQTTVAHSVSVPINRQRDHSDLHLEAAEAVRGPLHALNRQRVLDVRRDHAKVNRLGGRAALRREHPAVERVTTRTMVHLRCPTTAGIFMLVRALLPSVNFRTTRPTSQTAWSRRVSFASPRTSYRCPRSVTDSCLCQLHARWFMAVWPWLLYEMSGEV